MELIKIENGRISSLALVKEINMFRSKEENKKELRHDNLLSVIRDEFEEEIALLKIKECFYDTKFNKNLPMFMLTINEAKQILVRESKIVRKAVIKRLDELEKQIKPNVPQTYAAALLEAGRLALENEKLEEKNKNLDNYSIGVLKYANRVTNTNKALAKEEHCITVTQFGGKFGLSGKVINEMLMESGLIRKMHEDKKSNKNKYKYVPNMKKEWFFRSKDKYSTLLITPSGVTGIEQMLRKKQLIF